MTNEGKVVLVATPIGNLGDLTLRAIATLRSVDWIYAEDTRHSRGLFAAHDIDVTGRLRSLHAHNEAERSAEVVRLVAEGATVAYVSDAGTPGISDPGERLVRACVDAGIAVELLPGPSALLSAVVLSGLPSTPFTFLGFLDRKGEGRARQLDLIARSEVTTVFYESPKRIAATLDDLAAVCGATRQAATARELTKLFEQVARGTLAELVTAIERDDIPQRGEFVVVVGPTSSGDQPEVDLAAGIDELLDSGMRVRDIADALAARHGLPRREVYEAVLDRNRVRSGR